MVNQFWYPDPCRGTFIILTLLQLNDVVWALYWSRVISKPWRDILHAREGSGFSPKLRRHRFLRENPSNVSHLSFNEKSNGRLPEITRLTRNRLGRRYLRLTRNRLSSGGSFISGWGSKFSGLILYLEIKLSSAGNDRRSDGRCYNPRRWVMGIFAGFSSEILIDGDNKRLQVVGDDGVVILTQENKKMAKEVQARTMKERAK